MVQDDESEADAIARLEAALDRISQHSTKAVPAAPATALVAARLDVLIGQLRDALAAGPDDEA